MRRFLFNLAVILVATASVAIAQQYKNLAPKDAKSALEKSKIVLVDVRTPDEWKAGHLAGAVLVDFYDANFDANMKKISKDNVVMVYCARGRRSASAAEKLSGWGYKNVINIAGGYEEWSKAGLPTTTK